VGQLHDQNYRPDRVLENWTTPAGSIAMVANSGQMVVLSISDLLLLTGSDAIFTVNGHSLFT
jgi:hypothetical protein